MVIIALHIVVAPKGKAHLSPGGKRLSESRARNAKGLLLGAVVEDSLPHHRTGHQAVRLRRHRIVDKVVQELVGVEHIPGLGIVNLEVEMWPRRVTCIPAEGNILSLRHGTYQR